MSDPKFKVGDRVSTTVKNHAGIYYKSGTVSAILIYGKYTIEWDRGDKTDVPENLISSEVETKKKVAELELEFVECEATITQKINEAVSLLKEAQIVSNNHGIAIREFYTSLDPLIEVLSDYGWATSSLSC